MGADSVEQKKSTARLSENEVASSAFVVRASNALVFGEKKGGASYDLSLVRLPPPETRTSRVCPSPLGLAGKTARWCRGKFPRRVRSDIFTPPVSFF